MAPVAEQPVVTQVAKQDAAKLQIARNHILKPLVWIACLLPLAWLIYGAYAGTLGANPIENITHRTGLTTLILLLTGLAITPLRRWTGLLWLIQYRRLLGLFAFFYGCLHLLIYIVLDQTFSVPSMIHDIAKRPFITMGMLAWLCLFPLALTSTRNSIRRLGKNWLRLHRLVYLAATAGAIHFYWLVKRDKHQPSEYLFVLAVLLSARLVLWLTKKLSAESAKPREPVTATAAD
jgi:sulfoxide reductase heme-binding subunit YedZ